MFLWTLAWACGGKDDTSGGDDTGGPDDTGDPADLVYPTGDRVLVYNGHGGHPGDGTGAGVFTDVDALWLDQLGWNTDVLDSWPDDLDAYRLIVLAAPGYEAEVAFEADAVAALGAALEEGTRVAVLSEPAMCGGAAVNDLLQALGTDLHLTGDGRDTYSVVTTGELDPTHQVVSGLSELTFRDPCYTAGGTTLVIDDQTLLHPLASAQRPGRGGDVVLFGDMSFLDDGDHLGDADNTGLALNLAVIEPAP